MKSHRYISLVSGLALGFGLLSAPVSAQTTASDNNQQSLQNDVNKAKSAKERIATNQARRNSTFSDFGQAYTDFKNKLNKN